MPKLSLPLLLLLGAAPAAAQPWHVQLVKAALERTKHDVTYDGSYLKIAYPGGDVPPEIGVCTDVVVRSYRDLGIDLQKEVHEDMARAFKKYPQLWGHRKADTNIDHRRVPNLRRFFERKGAELPVTREPADYKPGDLVTWNLRRVGSLPHIGIVTDRKAPSGRPLIVHNIGAGPELEDMLFKYKITGHYRWPGPAERSP